MYLFTDIALSCNSADDKHGVKRVLLNLKAKFYQNSIDPFFP